MVPIVLLEGEQLRAFLELLASCQDVRRLRFAIDEGLKVKVDEHGWSRPLGEMRRG